MRDLHRTVSVFLYHKEEVLLTCHPKYDGRWMGIGGHIEPGELAHEAVEREVLEEVGLDVKFPLTIRDERAVELPVPIAVISYLDNNRLDEDFIYFLEVSKYIRNAKLAGDQAEQSRWFNIFETRGYKMFDDTRQHLNQLAHIIIEKNRYLDWRPL